MAYIKEDEWLPFERLIPLTTFGASPNAGGLWLRGAERANDNETWRITSWHVLFRGFESDPPDRFARARLGVDHYSHRFWERPLFYFIDDAGTRARADPIVVELLQRVTILEAAVHGREINHLIIEGGEQAVGQVELARMPPEGAVAEMLIVGRRRTVVS